MGVYKAYLIKEAPSTSARKSPRGSRSSSSAGVLSNVFGLLEVPEHLGYPFYLATLLGTWKLLAVVALIFGSGWPRLKEWAFAGLFFNLTGAVVSHLALGDPLAQSAPAAVMLLVTGVTYAVHRRFVQTHQLFRTDVVRSVMSGHGRTKAEHGRDVRAST